MFESAVEYIPANKHCRRGNVVESFHVCKHTPQFDGAPL